ncbi:MAG: sodium:solute symporter family transporter [Gammaproteobacteria bacterium]
MQNTWLILVAGVYLLLLVAATWVARTKTHNNDDYMFAGSNVGALLGCLTFSATLFSTFTLMGMPDFFRTHGIGAWIFLGVADAAVAFVILWYALPLRQAAARHGFQGVAGLLISCYKTRNAGYLYFLGLFLFLIPYVAVQIRGIGILLNAAYPDTLPNWAWSLIIVVSLLVYSEIGGLKAIIYSDAMQGLVLLVVTWIIAYGCVTNFDGIRNMMLEIRDTNVELLSVPGPRGLFTFQFLLASLLAILALPITQPQLATRLVIMKNLAESKKMAVAVGIFSMLVILPTMGIGLFGALAHPDLTSANFLARVLIQDQTPYVAALVAVGLTAAAMSTADSQLFALGAEVRALSRNPADAMLRTRLAIGVFAAAAFFFAISSTDQLVLLARVSFAGTALLAPLILSALLSPTPNSTAIMPATLIALTVFTASILGFIPSSIFELRLDLLLFACLSAIGFVTHRKRQ